MGPRASAEFVKTIYSIRDSCTEQDLPTVLLISAPDVPDRTASIARNSTDILRQHVSMGIDQLLSLGAEIIVVCCVTVHHVFPMLSLNQRAKVLSLIDVVFETLVDTDEKFLLLCTRGSASADIFTSHPLWHSVADRLVLPSSEDQEKVQSVIYDIKLHGASEEHVVSVREMLEQYRVNAYIAGCTELHLLRSKDPQFARSARIMHCIDPLNTIAYLISGTGPSALLDRVSRIISFDRGQ
ncbi:MAG: aspartate/glutamate racemase family protein [Acidobacteria bacterium]|nr:aspartate/glutamate racemase family protein [Acidobacteriota bacterium]